MEWLLAAQSISQGSFLHVITSTPHDRGHADPESRSPHPKHLPAPGLHVRPPFQQVTGSIGPGGDSDLSGVFDKRKKSWRSVRFSSQFAPCASFTKLPSRRTGFSKRSFPRLRSHRNCRLFLAPRKLCNFSRPSAVPSIA